MKNKYVIHRTIPVLKAKICILVGDYKKIKKHIPYGCDQFKKYDYVARCCYIRMNDNLPFTIVIHSKILPLVLFHMKLFMLLLIY